MAFADFFRGREPSVRQASTVTPEQQQAMSQLLQLLPQAQQSFNFEPIAQAAQQRFQQETQPGIGERFGAMQAKRSSGYNQALANAYRDLQTNLAAQQSQFGLQSQGNLANLLGMGLKPQFENIYEQGEESPFASLLGQALPLAAAYFTGGSSLPITQLLGGLFGGALVADKVQLLLPLECR